MAFNGNGTFLINSAGQPVVPGSVITSTAFNALTSDLATGLTNTVCKDGQSVTSASIPFGQGASFGGNSPPSQFSSGGALGINTIPINILDITQTRNDNAIISLVNASTGGAATSLLQLKNNASFLGLGQRGINYTPTGMTRADGAEIAATGAGGLSIYTTAAQPIYFGINSSEVARFDASGFFLEGYTSSNGPYRLQVNSQIFATSSTIATSDKRIKNDLGEPTEPLLAAALAVPTRLYTRKDHPEYGTRAGYWAQDWLGALNENGVVAGGAAGSDTAGMVPLNLDGHYGLDESAVQTLKIAALEKKIQALEVYLSALEAKGGHGNDRAP